MCNSLCVYGCTRVPMFVRGGLAGWLTGRLLGGWTPGYDTQMTRLHAQHPHVVSHAAAVNSCCPGWCLSEMSATIAANNDTRFAKSAAQGAVSCPPLPALLHTPQDCPGCTPSCARKQIMFRCAFPGFMLLDCNSSSRQRRNRATQWVLCATKAAYHESYRRQPLG